MSAGQAAAKKAFEPAASEIDFLHDLAAVLFTEINALYFSEQSDAEWGVDLKKEVKIFEMQLIEQALKKTSGNQVKAAGLLGLNKATLNAKIRRSSSKMDKKYRSAQKR